MGFVNHGGMWGDLLILPIAAASIIPRLDARARSATLLLSLFAVAVGLSLFAHAQWSAMGAILQTTDHVFPTHASGLWYRDISVAGWMHVAYMALQLAVFLGYIAVPMPREVILLVSGLLSVHLVIGQIEPGWYSTGEIWVARNVIPTGMCLVITWSVAVLKLRAASKAVLSDVSNSGGTPASSRR